MCSHICSPKNGRRIYDIVLGFHLSGMDLGTLPSFSPSFVLIKITYTDILYRYLISFVRIIKAVFKKGSIKREDF